MRRSWAWATLATVAVTLFVACHSNVRQRMPVVVASGKTPEQLVLGKITVLALEAANYDIVDRTGFGNSRMIRSALEAGKIDIYWEYTGDTWTGSLGHDRPIADPAELYQRVHDEDASNGITWLPPAPCHRALGLVVRQTTSQEEGIGTLSDLARYLDRVNPDLRLCTPEEFYERAGGLRGLERVYGLRFDRDKTHFMPTEEGYQALMRGDCDCTLGFATDVASMVPALCALKDDKGFFQASSLAVAIRTSVLEEFLSLEQTLVELSQLLTQEAMAELRRQVVVEGDKPETVAKRFLSKNGVTRPGARE